MIWLYIYIAGWLIGIGRGVTEAVKFNYKNGESNLEYVDTPEEYHTYTLIMWIGVLFLCISAYGMGTEKAGTFDFLVGMLLTFCSYYFPYCMFYNFTRKRGWLGDFYYDAYMFDVFGKVIKISYINKYVGIAMNIFALAMCVLKAKGIV